MQEKRTLYLAGKITGDPYWKESKGAKYEFGEAMAQNKPFFFFADWEREGSQNAEK